MLEVAKHPSPPGNRRPTMTEAYDGRQVVGMDLHRRRSVLVRMTEDGRKLETVRIANSSAALRRLARGGPAAGVAGLYPGAAAPGVRDEPPAPRRQRLVAARLRRADGTERGRGGADAGHGAGRPDRLGAQ